jgi:hypothetical protein
MFGRKLFEIEYIKIKNRFMNRFQILLISARLCLCLAGLVGYDASFTRMRSRVRLSCRVIKPRFFMLVNKDRYWIPNVHRLITCEEEE